MKRFIALACACAAITLFATPIYATGSAETFTYRYNPSRTNQVIKIICAWTSDSATGAVTGTTSLPFNGKLIGLETIPSGGGTAPTDNYDITVLDADTHDVLLGQGADRDTANTEYVDGTHLSGVASSALTFTLANCGNSKQGTIILWIQGQAG